MSGLFSQLDSSVHALQAQSRALDVASRNLANVNNPNYARQRVVFGERGEIATTVGTQSTGLEALSVQQVRDSLLDQQVAKEAGVTTALTSEQAALQRAQAGLGETIDASGNVTSITSTSSTNGLNSSLSQFFNAFQSLASNPTDSGERQNLVQRASILTDALNSTDSHLAQVQTDINSQISTDVAQANQILSTIATLNRQIGGLEVTNPGSAVDLRDQRQAQLEALAKIMPFNSQGDTNNPGQIIVSSKSTTGTDVILVQKATVLGSVTFSGSGITAGSPATAIALTAGSLKGNVTARDGAIQTLRGQLDTLSRQLVVAVNAAYNPTGLTGNFFASSGIAAGTIALDPSLTAANLKASDTGGAAGDNTIAKAVANLSSKSFSTGALPPDVINGTLSQYYANAVTGLGQAIASSNSRVTDQAAVEKLVKDQRDSISGVSMDEEMADLLKYQRAFQASSKVFTITDQLLDTVIHMGA